MRLSRLKVLKRKRRVDNRSRLVSVVIPFFNAPRLSLAIESILHQSYTDFELLLVNNNSDDDILEVAERYAAKDNRIQVLHESQQGVVFAMNKGIMHSKGAFIMRMDADDISYPDRITNQVEAFDSDPFLQVISGLITYEGSQENEGFRMYVEWLNYIKTDEEIKLNRFVEFPLANPSIIYKKEVFQAYGLFEDGDFPEDYEYFLRLCSKNVVMGKVNRQVLKWHDSNQRLTRTDPRYSHDSFYKIKARYLADWLAISNPFHPKVLIWGEGRLSRKRSNHLKDYGIEIQGYIDVIRKPDVIHYKSIPDPKSCFIVSYVAYRGARDEIRNYLLSKGYKEGANFILAS